MVVSSAAFFGAFRASDYPVLDLAGEARDTFIGMSVPSPQSEAASVVDE